MRPIRSFDSCTLSRESVCEADLLTMSTLSVGPGFGSTRGAVDNVDDAAATSSTFRFFEAGFESSVDRLAPRRSADDVGAPELEEEDDASAAGNDEAVFSFAAGGESTLIARRMSSLMRNTSRCCAEILLLCMEDTIAVSSQFVAQKNRESVRRRCFSEGRLVRLDNSTASAPSSEKCSKN